MSLLDILRWRKGLAAWRCGDALYLSVPFTWLLDDAEILAREHKGPIFAGGPAVKLCGAPWAQTPDDCPFDTLSMHNPLATFTTRGCPNRCAFCAAPKIEGEFRQLDTWKPAPIVCDNNLTEATKQHFEKVIDGLRDFPMVDFNQGFDAHRFTGWHAEQITRLRSCKVRFAFDCVGDESAVHAAIDTARRHGLNNFGVYVLIGFKDTPDDALYRLEWVRRQGIRPTPMRYQPLNARTFNSYVAPGWTEELLQDVTRYYSRLRWFDGFTFKEYQDYKHGRRLFDVVT